MISDNLADVFARLSRTTMWDHIALRTPCTRRRHHRVKDASLHGEPNPCLLHASAAGLLASGLIPAVRHSLLHLLTADARVLPAAATVFFQVLHALGHSFAFLAAAL